jgi:nicotinate phosphoribosyltransferase
MTASALSTDLYQLTMMAGYFAAGRHESVAASFELFVRRLPPHRNYLVAAGLETLLAYLEHLHFTDAEISWISEQPSLRGASLSFFDYLRGMRFTGDVWAMREGTPAFPNEPLLRVTAPLAQAQLVETAALAIVNFQTSVASKAARVVTAAGDRPVMEFGARRAHGTEAALYAARAAHLAGCAGTSYVEAGRRFGIPLSGTMAHSWVLSAENELEAFARYSDLFGEHSTLLLDTYDTVTVARALTHAGLRPAAVRLDSGDLAALSREVRAILNEAGLHETKIVASGDLDEYEIRRLTDAQAPVDAFGVGTSVVTSIDAPALGGVYKLVELSERGRSRRVMKRSPANATWPGCKQVWRVFRGGAASHDVIGFVDEGGPSGATPLLDPVMRGGRCTHVHSLRDAREWCRERVRELPVQVHDIAHGVVFETKITDALREAIS